MYSASYRLLITNTGNQRVMTHAANVLPNILNCWNVVKRNSTLNMAQLRCKVIVRTHNQNATVL